MGSYYSMHLVATGKIMKVYGNGYFDVAVTSEEHPYSRIGKRRSDSHNYQVGEGVFLRFFLDNENLPYIDSPLSDFPFRVAY